MTNLDEIIVHAGLHKTATSSFQQALYDPHNRKRLEKNNIATVSDWPANNSIPMCTLFNSNPERYHIHIRNGLSPTEVAALRQRYLLSLEKSLSNCRCGKLIVSAESISMLSVDNLNEFKNRVLRYIDKPITFSVLLLTRHPLNFAVSAIQQHVKSGFAFSAALREEKKQINAAFQNQLGRLTDAFGKTHISAYPFEQACRHALGPVGFLFEKAGVPPRKMKTLKIHRRNVSISQIAGNIAAYVNERIPVLITPKQLNPRRSPNDLAPLFAITGKKYDIPNSDKKTLAGLCADDCQWLKRNFDIDYTTTPFCPTADEDATEIVIDKTTIQQLKAALKKVSRDIRPLVLEYLAQQSFQFDSLKNEQRFSLLLRAFTD